jgi:hypothetical protein
MTLKQLFQIEANNLSVAVNVELIFKSSLYKPFTTTILLLHKQRVTYFL